jgi:hypothetical protein
VSFIRIDIKKAPRTLRWWSFLKKPHVGIAEQSRLLEGLNPPKADKCALSLA